MTLLVLFKNNFIEIKFSKSVLELHTTSQTDTATDKHLLTIFYL